MRHDSAGTRRIAVSAIAAVIVVIVVIAAAGAAYYALVLRPGGTTPSTTPATSSTASGNSTQTSATSASTAQSSSSSSTTSSATSTGVVTSSSTTTGVTSATTSQATASSTVTATGVTCTNTFTTGTISTTTTQTFVKIFQTFKQMTFQFSGSTNGSAMTGSSFSYNTVYTTTSGGVTTWKVNFTVISGNQTFSSLAWAKSDGTVIAVYSFGQNFTGAQAAGVLEGSVAIFGIELNFQNLLSEYTSPIHFHVINTTTVTLGPTTMQVTNYGANSLPLALTYCDTTTNITAFVMQVGTVPGTSTTLITVMHFAGTTKTDGGGTTTEDFVLKVVSLAKT